MCQDEQGKQILDGPQIQDENCTPGARRAGVCDDGAPGLRVEECSATQVWTAVTQCIHGPDGGAFVPLPSDPGGKDPGGGNTPPPDPQNKCTTFEELEQTKYDSDATIDGCYDVNATINVSAALTINPGTVLRFAEETGIYVGINGSLYAVGTQDAPIALIGQKNIQGFWSGVKFQSTHSISNQLTYVIIDGGGYIQDANSGGIDLSTSSSGHTVSAAITHTVVRNSGHYGIHGTRNVTLTKFENNNLSGNPDGPIKVRADTLPALDNASNYGDPDTDRIIATTSGIGAGELAVTSVPYLFEDGLKFARENETLTIAPGAILEFAQGKEMRIESGGILSALGTDEQRIILRGEEPTAGFWYGLHFRSTDKLDNQLRYVTIADAGKSTASLRLTTGSSGDRVSCSLDHTEFTNSGTAKISMERNSTINDCQSPGVTKSDVVGEPGRIDQLADACGL